MTTAAAMKTSEASIGRAEPTSPILKATGRTTIVIRAGTTIRIDGETFAFDRETPITTSDLLPGEDYGVKIGADERPFASLLGPENALDAGWIAGFHFAPGGNAEARAGGDATPALNPCSIWDLRFRPTCPDPRGMTFGRRADGHPFWADIYLLGVDHRRNGTSRCGVTIADGNTLARLNCQDAVDIYASHGKRLLTYDEFRAAAFGVTERSAVGRHPKTTGLDAPRTSRIGLMQPAGNLWQWGTDGDPDDPRPSFFGGSWLDGSLAGSRFAHLGIWGDPSVDYISARGASDHLAPA